MARLPVSTNPGLHAEHQCPDTASQGRRKRRDVSWPACRKANQCLQAQRRRCKRTSSHRCSWSHGGSSFLSLRWRTLRRDHNHLGCRRIGNRVVRYDFQSATRNNGRRGLRHRVETEGVVFAVGNAGRSKTSHGPQKSITTAPLEIRKATGMDALAGGVSGLRGTASCAAPNVEAAAPGRANEPAAVKPRAAER